MYRVIKIDHNNSPSELANFLNKEAEEGYHLISVDSGWYIFSNALPLKERNTFFYAMDMISKDMHTVSSRPCETCRFISRALDKPFGCYAYQKKMP